MTEAAPAAQAAPAQGAAGAPAAGTGTPAAGTEGAPAAGATPQWYENKDFGFKPEEVATIQNKAWKSPRDMFNSYAELEKFRGADEKRLITLPSEPTDKDGMRKVFERLGLPAKAEDYKFELSNDAIKKGVQKLPEAFEKTIRNGLHTLGVPSEQAAGVYALVADMVHADSIEFAETTRAKDEADVSKLKTEWGAAWGEKVELAKRAGRAAGLDENAINAIANEGGKGSGTTLRMLAKFGEMLQGSDKFVTGNAADPTFGATKEQLQQQLATLDGEIGADPKLFAQVKKGVGPYAEKRKALLAKMEAMDTAE